MADRVLRTLFLQLESGKRRATIRHLEDRDSIAETPAEIMVKELAAEDIKIEKELLYDKHNFKRYLPL